MVSFQGVRPPTRSTQSSIRRATPSALGLRSDAPLGKGFSASLMPPSPTRFLFNNSTHAESACADLTGPAPGSTAGLALVRWIGLARVDGLDQLRERSVPPPSTRSLRLIRASILPRSGSSFRCTIPRRTRPFFGAMASVRAHTMASVREGAIGWRFSCDGFTLRRSLVRLGFASRGALASLRAGALASLRAGGMGSVWTSTVGSVCLGAMASFRERAAWQPIMSLDRGTGITGQIMLILVFDKGGAHARFLPDGVRGCGRFRGWRRLVSMRLGDDVRAWRVRSECARVRRVCRGRGKAQMPFRDLPTFNVTHSSATRVQNVWISARLGWPAQGV